MYCPIIQISATAGFFRTRPATSVATIIPKKTKVATIRTGSNIFFNCLRGPDRKNVLEKKNYEKKFRKREMNVTYPPMEMMLPKDTMTAKPVSFPTNSIGEP